MSHRSGSPRRFPASAFIPVLALAALARLPAEAASPEAEYSFETIAVLGQPAPGGRNFVFDFEPWSITSKGCAFTADLDLGMEGLFIRDDRGDLKLAVRGGDPAPTGGVFGAGFPGPITLGENGILVFQAILPNRPNSPAGVFRYDPATEDVTAILAPPEPAPGGGTFVDGTDSPRINRRGEVVLGMIINASFFPPDIADVLPAKDCLGLSGVYLAHPDGTISKVLLPGDLAPGGKAFDMVIHPSLNDLGDIGFGAHLDGEECAPPHGCWLPCGESVYLRRACGEIVSIAHQGDDAPGGGKFRIAFGALVNNRGEVLFVGDVTPPPDDPGRMGGIFLYTGGKVISVARPGDDMPGGGKLRTCSFYIGSEKLNQLGEVGFAATLDTVQEDLDCGDETKEEAPDQGYYVWSREKGLRLVARSGTEIFGLGKIAFLLPPDFLKGCYYPRQNIYPYLGGVINDRGQALFTAAVRDGDGALQGALLLATPKAPPAPRFGLDSGEAEDGLFVVRLSAPEEYSGFSFGIELQGDCHSARILSVEPGPDLPGRPETWQVEILDFGRRASVRALYTADPPGGLPGPGDGLKVAAVQLAGRTESDCCRLSFRDAVDPSEVIAVMTAGREVVARSDTYVPVPAQEALCFRRGDADESGTLDITDVVFLLEFQFLGGDAPGCLDAADADDSGVLDITDAVYSLEFQFLGGSAPPAPGPTDCGTDLNAEDTLDCGRYDPPGI